MAPRSFSGRPVCYPVTERCNYQLYCADGSDERDCTVCQPGTFHCDSDRSVFGNSTTRGNSDKCLDVVKEMPTFVSEAEGVPHAVHLQLFAFV